MRVAPTDAARLSQGARPGAETSAPAAARGEDGDRFEAMLKKNELRQSGRQSAKLHGQREDAVAEQVLVSAASGHEPPGLPVQGKSAQDDARGVDAHGTAGAEAQAPNAGDAAEASSSVERPMADAALAARFAERLDLLDAHSSQSRLYLDKQHYQLSEVVITGGGEEGLSLAYRHSDARDEHGRDAARDTLRQRLEARGIRVNEIR